MKKSLLTWATTLAVVGAMALPALAGGGGGGGGRGGRGAGGGGAGGGGAGGGGAGGFGGGGGAGGGRGGPVDPAMQITNTLATVRTSLGITADDEWNVLAAKIQKVLEAKQKLAPGQPNAMGGGRGGRGGGGGGGGGGAGAPVDATNPLAVAMGDLRSSTAMGTTTADNDLKTKLKTLRDARTTATAAVTSAQADLQKVVTVRQEAILVTLGILD